MMFWARLETRSFTFDAFGATKSEALMAMHSGWVKHAQQTGATMGWEIVADDVYVIEVHAGECLRDRDFHLNYEGQR